MREKTDNKKIKALLFIASFAASSLFITGCADMAKAASNKAAEADCIIAPEFPAAELTMLPGSEITKDTPSVVAPDFSAGQGGLESTNASLVITAPKEAEPEEPDEITYTVYRVKQGDMIGLLAESFGITQDTIISVNNIKQSRLLQKTIFQKLE